MLEFKLSLDGTSAQWAWRAETKKWGNDSSWISPIQHPLLERMAVSDGISTFLVVRERTAQSPVPRTPQDRTMLVTNQTFEEMLKEALEWPLEFQLIECRPGSGYRIHAGQWGTCPIYISDTKSSGLIGSWSFRNLRPQMGRDRINLLEVVRILSARQRYTHNSIFQGIHQLTERSCAEYSNEGLTLHYPEDAPHGRPREVRPGVDIIPVYEEELARAVSLRPYSPSETAVELSGGLDSANVAMTLSDLNSETIMAYALTYGGDIGEQQVRRRQEMIEYGNFRDMQLNALEWPPLHPMGGRAQGDAVDPIEQPYHEAFEKLLEKAAVEGIRTIFTGDGGDELASLRGDEWEQMGKIPGRYNPLRILPTWFTRMALELVPHIDDDLAPRSILDEASLLGFASRTPSLVTHGMWPISPLCSPRLIRFAEQLPVEWRDNKRFCRERLRRLEFSDEVVNPTLRENFTHVMWYGLRRYGEALVEQTVEDSILVDLGLADPDQVLTQSRRLSAEEAEPDTTLFAYLRMELGLRGLLG